MSGNQIHFSYALWNSPLEQAMLRQGKATYTVAYHTNEHCTLTVQEGQAVPSSQVLSLDECEDILGELGLLRTHGWQAIYPENWLTDMLENQKHGNEHKTAVGGAR